MFYGSGAGKLPTASAVVADVVDAAKHLNRNIMTMWASDKLEIEDKADAVRRFFVRMSGDENEMLPKVEKAFGKVELIKVEGPENEFGFLTGEMMEGAYDICARRFENSILHMIRVEG